MIVFQICIHAKRNRDAFENYIRFDQGGSTSSKEFCLLILKGHISNALMPI